MSQMQRNPRQDAFVFYMRNSPLRHITRWCTECDWYGLETQEGTVAQCPACSQDLYPDRIITFGATQIYYWALKDRFFLRHPGTRPVKARLPHSGEEANYYTFNHFPVAIWSVDLLEAVLFLVKNSEKLKT